MKHDRPGDSVAFVLSRGGGGGGGTTPIAPGTCFVYL